MALGSANYPFVDLWSHPGWPRRQRQKQVGHLPQVPGPWVNKGCSPTSLLFGLCSGKDEALFLLPATNAWDEGEDVRP